MLYVFHVDTGNMLTLDMSLTTESVQTLKRHIQADYRIPADLQVLLISGGECLDSTKRVCSYSSGTDTNPIYLFCKSMNDAPRTQATVLDFREDVEIIEREKLYAELPPSVQTITKRAQLAQQFADRATFNLRICEGLVADQHNQHQGWAAVMANFDDVLAEFKSQFNQLKSDFDQYLEERDTYLQFLSRFQENMHILRKVPVLTSLLKINQGNKYLSETADASEGKLESISEGTEESCVTLFDWIGRDEQDNDVEQIYENCLAELMENDLEKFNKLCRDVDTALNTAERQDMKKIRGLGLRFYSLDEMIHDAKDKTRLQNELAATLSQNENRVHCLKDPSIIPDLCLCHINQLHEMARCHNLLVEQRKRMTKGKHEMNVTLQTRLQWVIHSQNVLQKIGILMDLFGEKISRVRYQIGVLEQVDLAPTAYLSCIAEIVRRRSYSQAFLVWASELACSLLTIHSEEVARRKDFRSKYDGHFINMLFPGMNDLPPNYGTRAPSYFDIGLPELTQEDLDFVKKELPELAGSLDLPECSDSNSYRNLFMSLMRHESDNLEERSASETALNATETQSENVVPSNMKDAGSQIMLHGLPYLKDLDRGFESETDTEEFEKVGQSPLEMKYEKEISSPRPSTQDAATLTEGNLEISRTEYDKLKMNLFRIGTVATNSLLQLKSELSDLKFEYTSDKNIILQHLQKVKESYEALCFEQVNHQKMLMSQMITDHSNEINDFRKLAQVKNEEIKNLRTNLTFLENRVRKVTDQLSTLKEESTSNDQKRLELENRIVTVEMEKERCVREVTERLTREHKNDMKTLQARFKLMTMERTPSDSNLDKTLEFSSLTNHESIINQLTENFEVEKEKAVNETLLKESEKWEEVLKKVKEDFEVEKNFMLTSLVNQISEEKDKQIEILRNREQALLEKVNQYSSTIEQLTNAETEDRNMGLIDKIEELENERTALTTEIQKMKMDRVDMVASVTPCQEGKTDTATSPIKQRKSLTKSLSVSSGKINKVSLDSLRQGDCVVVVWDEKHESFKVIQDSSVLYFLHSDSVSCLNLEITEGPPKKPNRLYCLGEYIDREYCYARKSENRYKVPKDTRFFRVKVRPLQRSTAPQPSPEIDIPISQSQAGSHRMSFSSNPEPEFHSLSPSPKIKSVTKLIGPEVSSGSAGDDVQSDPELKKYSVDDELAFQTALYDFSERGADSLEEPASQSLEINR